MDIERIVVGNLKYADHIIEFQLKMAIEETNELS